MVTLSYRNAINNSKILVDCDGIGISSLLSGKTREQTETLISQLEGSTRSLSGSGGQQQVSQNQVRKNKVIARCLRIRIGRPEVIAPAISDPDIQERVIDRAAQMLERERKVKDGTSNEVVRIVEIGTGGEQIGTS